MGSCSSKELNRPREKHSRSIQGTWATFSYKCVHIMFHGWPIKFCHFVTYKTLSLGCPGTVIGWDKYSIRARSVIKTSFARVLLIFLSLWVTHHDRVSSMRWSAGHFVQWLDTFRLQVVPQIALPKSRAYSNALCVGLACKIAAISVKAICCSLIGTLQISHTQYLSAEKPSCSSIWGSVYWINDMNISLVSSTSSVLSVPSVSSFHNACSACFNLHCA